MARLIDADELKKKFADPDVLEEIGYAPTIEPEFDPLPCRKCRYHNGSYCLHPDTYGRYVHDDDYCAWAERETDDGE